MLKFANLTLSQKRFVVAVLAEKPQYKKDPQITLKECASIYYILREQRNGAKGEKIGYPNWLFNANKVERGLYQLPVPTAEEMKSFNLELDAKQNPVKAAKAKVAKVAKVTVAKTKAKPVATKTVTKVAKDSTMDTSRLQSVIAESDVYDDDTEDFNQILRENGIEI
jgi:hypothetical protein